ncbi:DinB family protein [Actinomadura kijaniata]|uniref:DinB family protein n=1 Tax=Actinomadura kijaniata TaxID=46161 RepID=UPI0008368A53|nr:DinB family protein [Actinomadura kijaniata]
MTTETETLLASLTAQRRHVQGILEGLGEDDLRRPLLPSGWSCLGLVRHLALDVERFWFRAVAAGDPAVIDGLGRAGDAWRVGRDASAASVLDRYRREIDAANAVIAATPLEAAPAWWPERFTDWRARTLRELLLHVITETACHAGHLDAARELIDGRRWLVLTT